MPHLREDTNHIDDLLNDNLALVQHVIESAYYCTLIIKKKQILQLAYVDFTMAVIGYYLNLELPPS